MFEHEHHKDQEAYAEVMDQTRQMDGPYTEMIQEIYKLLKRHKKTKVEMLRFVMNKALKVYISNYNGKRDNRF